MTAFTGANYLSNAARTEAEMKQAFEDNLAATKQIPGAGVPLGTVTIATGVITPTGGFHIVETEAAAATDDLTNIAQTNLPDGSGLLFGPATAGHTVVVKHNAGGIGLISLVSGSDFTMNNTNARLWLVRIGTLWAEIWRDYGSDQAGYRAFHSVPGFAQNTFTGRQDGAKGANLTAASTLTLGTDGNYFVVTGTTTIVGISSAPAGTVIRLQFQSSGCLIAHNATSLIMHYGSHLTRAGDVLEFVSEGSGNWREVAPAGQPRVLEHVTANTTVASTAAETTLYTTTLQANVLGTARKVRLTLACRYAYSGPSASLSTLSGTVFRLKYGATTIAAGQNICTYTDSVGGQYGGIADSGLLVKGLLCGDGATNAQLGILAAEGIQMHSVSPTTDFGFLAHSSIATSRGTAAEDSTVAKTLSVTVQHNQSSGSNSITVESAVLEVLP